jgi:hypothetical protein
MFAPVQTGPGPSQPCTVYNGYRIFFPGVKWSGRGVDHPPSSSGEVKEGVDQYLYFPRRVVMVNFSSLCACFTSLFWRQEF